MCPKPNRVRFLPLTVILATMPAMMVPLLVTMHLSGPVMGPVMGIPIGLSLVAIAWLARGLARERRER